MSRPLHNIEKAHIVILAQQAYDAYLSRIHTSSRQFQSWRQTEQLKACGLRHLTACTIDHYPILKAHFNRILGRSQLADNQAFDAMFSPRERALVELMRECDACSCIYFSPHAYADGYLRRAFDASFQTASVKQLWVVIKSMRERRERRANTGRRTYACIDDHTN